MRNGLLKYIFPLTCMVLLVFAQGAWAQRSVSGQVTSADDGSGVPGVSVLLKGTSTGTTTDLDGNYRLSVGEDGGTLVFSFIGMTTQEVEIGNRTVIDVSMQTDITQLQEVVVTGYATQNKKDLTGSVGVVKPAELVAMPTGNIATQLQGRLAGVNVVGSGQPGQTSKVRIRGFGSLTNNDPLYVVDGVPMFDVSTLNPNDIESISVLKDAGAASIYGSRASNGVILVTTKKGGEGVQVNYSMYTGTQNPGAGPSNLANAQEYADTQWLVYKNDGTVETHPVYGPSSNATPQFPAWAADTNWWDAITDPAAISNHDLTFSGGNQNATFFGGVNYFKQDGIILYNYTKRVSARFNSTFKVKDRVTFGENVQVTYRTGNGTANLNEGSPIADLYRSQPIIPVVMDQSVVGLSHDFVPGDWGGTGIAARLGNGQNVVADRTRNKDDIGFDTRFVGSVFADLKIIEGLNFKTTMGGTFQNNYWTDYTFSTYENSENVATAAFNEGASYGRDWVWTNALTFNKTIDMHRFLVVAGYEANEYGIGRGLEGRRAGYFSDAVSFRTLSNGASVIYANSWFNTPTRLLSNFARLDYSFNDKYLFSATVRRDGSSVFGQDYKFGVFPSLTAGWRVSEESFLQGNSVITDLKIRGGYGQMGNQRPVGPGNRFALYGGGIGDAFYALDGSTGSSMQGFRPTQIANLNARWETNVTTNIGFDAGLFDNKLEIVFDWYSKQTKDLLYGIELPGTVGAASVPAQNVAEMSNTGIDLQLIYRNNITSDLSVEGNVTFTTYNNEIVKIADGIDYFDYGGSRIGSFNRNQVGSSMSSFFGYEVAGLWQSAQEIADADQNYRTLAAQADPTLTAAQLAALSAQAGAEEGFFRYVDQNGDGHINDDDRTMIGNPNPDFTLGFNLNVNYKNFDLSAFIYGSKGNDVFNYMKWWTDFWPSFQGTKSKDLLYNSWTPENTGATTPKASNTSNFSTNTVSNSYYVEDGSYTRLKNLQIGYNLPQSVLSNIGIGSARVYLQGVNLFTITKYSGLDPELGGDDRAYGVDHGNYPNVKQFLFGVNIGL
ncbi:MAG: TonB-dependent receptor [Cyclobacteriaceae bacterium]|nr:TonB-dependent receptor [Cyclobacteriaceae bacterium]